MSLKVGTVIETGRPFSLPEEIVTEALGILAKRRVGKTYTASVVAEEMLRSHFHIVVIDPTGAWWGLRASADGKGPGFPIIVMGGDHGDVPLEETGGEVVARFVIESGQSVILDVSGFSKAGQRRFVAAFLAYLYRFNRQPLHVFIDEADEFAPQMLRGESANSFAAVDDVVRRGGIKGLGCSLITQRSAAINKDVLTQCEILIVLRTIAPNDRKAIEAWVDVQHGTSEQQRALMSSLPTLKKGEAWFWAPGTYEFFALVQVRERVTFDSSRTPKVGERRVMPKQLAPVDLERLTREMAATIEKKKQEDPRELHKVITDLRRQLATKLQSNTVARTSQERVVEKRVEVPILKASQIKRLEAVVLRGETTARTIQQGLSDIAEAIRRALASNRGSTLTPTPAARASAVGQGREPAAPRPRATGLGRAAAAARPAPAGDLNGELGAGERKVLAVLAQWPEGRSQRDLAFLTGYSARASTIGVILSKLRKLELVEQGQPVRLTEAGVAQAGGLPELPTGPDLLAYWMSHPRVGGGERKVLEVLVETYPESLSHQELAERTNYSADASTLGVVLSKLRKLGLVESRERKLRPEFAEAIA